MLKLLTDENLNGAILRGLERKYPELDIIRVQDTEAAGFTDSELLTWAAREARILVSHDQRTLPRHIEECINAGVKTAGVILVPREFILTTIVEDVALIAHCVEPEELEQQWWRLPL